MSTESLFASSSNGAHRSRPLQRRLFLLQAVLPCFPLAIEQAGSSAKRFKREFWTNFLTPFSIMKLGKNRLDRIDDQHDGLVSLVLEQLEMVVSMGESDIAENFRHSQFPRLETLRKLKNEVTADSDDVLMKLVKPSTAAECDQLLNSLQELSSVIRDDTKQPPPEDTQMTSKSKPLLAPLLLSLFSTISKYWRCSCKTPHQATLLLFTNRKLPKNDSEASFTVFLSRAMSLSPAKRWQETNVTVCEQLPKPKVRIKLEDSNIKEKIPVTNLCVIVKTIKTRLNLNVNGASLSRQAETDLQMKHFENCEPVSFTKGFLENEIELGLEGKLCLAVILSYAFLDFCGNPWFPAGWAKDSFYFMQDGQNLFLQPFLVTNMTAVPRESRAPAAARTMRLLQHGILLMEVFQQDPLRVTPKSGNKIASLEDTAQELFRSIDWDVCERFGQVVGACIKGRLTGNATMCSQPAIEPSSSHSLGSLDMSEEDFGRLFCEKILAPLEADFASQWQDKDPDQIISTLKLPSIKQESRPSLKPRTIASKFRPPQKARPSSRTPSPFPPQRTHQPPLGLNPYTSNQANSKFLDVVDSPDSSQVKGALQWFENFDEDMRARRLPRVAANRKNVIKIAVLDTGIKLEIASMSQRERRIQCWPSKTDCEDTDGHGTHVAHLLLLLAPHAHLRICKVSKTRLFTDVNIKQIADAITHFSTGQGKVDIINLSFGFAKYSTKLNPILTAIRTARTNGVVIFAAAGNEGGNQGVFWPAALHDGGYVIRINSSNGYGVPSGFNPDPELGHRICTLGEGVPSCEPDPDDPDDPDDPPRAIHRSGTSFATPIAAAIGAIVLGFMDNADCSEFKDAKELLPRLRTAVGMEKVLCKTCVQSGEFKRSNFSYITPWFFLREEEKIRVPMILKVLSRVHEAPDLLGTVL